ncbi:MAG: hypothetical protein OYH77_06840 [Pseudomonadota bacterium]|nr:hypothetical protein [Pseudomonadota bacterium]
MLLSEQNPQYKQLIKVINLYRRHHHKHLKLRVLRNKNNLSALVRLIKTQKVHALITDLPRPLLRNNLLVSCLDNHVPILYMAKREAEDPYLLRSVYPDFDQLIKQAVDEGVARNFRSIAILSNSKDSNIAHKFKKYAHAKRLRVETAFYDGSDFQTMNQAVRKLFQVEEDVFDTEDGRKTRFQQLQKYDAIFLPDNFKMLVYFNKILKFYNVESVPMIGMHRWRLPKSQLIATANGYFVDFIGNYSSLPAGLNKTPQDLPAINAIDLQLLGYRGLAYLVAMVDFMRASIRVKDKYQPQVWQYKLSLKFAAIKQKIWSPQVVNL